jgi:hypothetical protein
MLKLSLILTGTTTNSCATRRQGAIFSSAKLENSGKNSDWLNLGHMPVSVVRGRGIMIDTPPLIVRGGAIRSPPPKWYAIPIREECGADETMHL